MNIDYKPRAGKSFAMERDRAFVEFVKTGETDKVIKYCKKYGVPIPKDEKIMAAGIYKAVQHCTNIPEDIKVLAMQKCMDIGFNPMMRFPEEDGEAE